MVLVMRKKSIRRYKWSCEEEASRFTVLNAKRIGKKLKKKKNIIVSVKLTNRY